MKGPFFSEGEGEDISGEGEGMVKEEGGGGDPLVLMPN